MSEALRLILASKSAARQAMLRGAGLQFDVEPADIAEEEIAAAMTVDNACVEAADIAAALAAEKALAVSRRRPGAIVVGSDQVLALGTRLFGKAESLAEARDVLDTLRGRSHELVSAVALAKDGEIAWAQVDVAKVTMRRFSDEVLDAYLARMGDRAMRSVGCYELEGPGVQLIDSIEGDYFTVLGMPLLPLLGGLRAVGAIAT